MIITLIVDGESKQYHSDFLPRVDETVSIGGYLYTVKDVIYKDSIDEDSSSLPNLEVTVYT